ncbi:MAG: hypothetical protein CMK32_04380 [Porticoccaceae bacterium]|nr:hypothetical protein [Porticoccaceae bacterium]
MDQDKIWDVYQNDPELQCMGCRDGGRVGFFARRLSAPAKVLNIGVGRGSLEKRLVDKGVDVYSLDPSETTVQTLRDSLALGERARVGYSQAIPFEENFFDYVVMTEVLEHLSDEVMDQTRAEVVRVLKSGGMFIGSVPADEDLLDSMVICPDCGKRFHRWGHLQSFSRRRLQVFLAKSFVDVSIQRVSFTNWEGLNWKGRMASIAKRLQASMDIKGARQNFFFRAKK